MEFVEENTAADGQLSLDSHEDEAEYDANDLKPFPAGTSKPITKQRSELKKTYYPTQESLANRILNRIKYILWLYCNKKQLSDFSKFDFQIYTARFCMLEEQTFYRLLAPEAACFPRLDYDDFKKLLKKARLRVSKYQAQDMERSRELQKRAKEEPETLFLIIADEAHWGVGKAEMRPISVDAAGKGTSGSGSGANDQLINCWTNDLSNVIVLLVTATGFNLKSEESRLPNQLAVILKDRGQSSADLQEDQSEDSEVQVLEGVRPVIKERNTYKDKYSGEIYTKQMVEREFVLHNVKWSEAHWDKIADGVIMKLRIPNKVNEDYRWLAMAQQKNEFGVYSLTVTSTKSESLELLVRGEIQSGVKICTVDEEYSLVVMEKRQDGINKYGLGFIYSTDASSAKYSDFKLKMECGEDVMIIHVVMDKAGSHGEYLRYQKREGVITLGKPPPTPNIEWLPSYPLDYSFLIDDYRSPEQLCQPVVDAENQLRLTSKPVKQYLSLNYYYNSMRNEPEMRLIRNDEHFQRMLQASRRTSATKKKQKHILPNDFRYLAADYGYFIILMDGFRHWRCFGVKSAELLFTEPTKAMEGFDEERHLRMDTFINHLKNYAKKDKLDVISVDDFKYVNNFYKKQCEDIMERLSQNGDDLDDQDVFKGLLTCLLFVDFSDDVMKKWRDLSKKLSEAELDKFLSELTNEQFEEMKIQILEKYETYRIVDTVLPSSVEEQDGKMVVVRLQKSTDKLIPPGNIFYATLCLARMVADECSEHFRFEIIRDFGNYKVSEVTNNIKHPQYRMHYRLQPEKCEYRDNKTLESCCEGASGGPCCEYKVKKSSLICINCQHKHREITTYEHLNTLPCILILVSKGRLGDTFPDSLFAMDCRLVYDGRPYLSTVMQEFGRVCRYFDKSAKRTPPYILIGARLHTFLSSGLREFADFRGIFVKDNILDPYMSTETTQKKSNKSLLAGDEEKMMTDDDDEELLSSLRPKKSHADHGNKEKHNLRILLEAEPQIGKTGVYLKVVSLLRQAVEGSNEDVLGSDTASEGEDDEELDDEEHMIDVVAEKWKYPYWKRMAELKFHDVQDLAGKYPRTMGSKPVEARPHSQHQTKAHLPRHGRRSAALVHSFRTYSFDDPLHKSCTKCKSEVSTVELFISVSGCGEILVSVPKSKRYLPFLTEIGLGKIDTTDSMPENIGEEEAGEMTIKTWIMTPSYRRSRDATLNYRHTMVTKVGGRKCNYQHFVVVRESEFHTYCSNWGGTHVIVQLPNAMMFEDGVMVAVDQGGIGYSRCFIQRFAKHHRQLFVFMIDDNVTSVYEIETRPVFGKECVWRKDGCLEVAKVPLFSVLKHLENQFLDSSKLLDLSKLGDYERYPDESLEPIKCYIGPDSLYGLTGILKYRKGILRVKNPFKKTHVYSLVLVNLDVLARKRIEYKPLKYLEDVNVNRDCNEAGLCVCKFNRFLLSKRRLCSNIVPPIFCWPDDVYISSDNPTEAKDSLKKLCHYIRWYKPPGRVELYPKVDNNRSEVYEVYEKFRQNIKGEHHLIIFVEKQIEHFADYLHKTKGIGGFELHLILLCEVFWKEHALKKKCHFQECLIQKYFDHVQEFEILSSHNVESYHVPYLLLYVKGRIHSPKDEACTKSVVGPKMQTRDQEGQTLMHRDQIQVAEANEKAQIIADSQSRTTKQPGDSGTEEKVSPIKKMKFPHDSSIYPEETKVQESDGKMAEEHSTKEDAGIREADGTSTMDVDIQNSDGDDRMSDDLSYDSEATSKRLGHHYAPRETSTEDESSSFEMDELPEQSNSDKSRASQSLPGDATVSATEVGHSKAGESSSLDETHHGPENIKIETLQNATNATDKHLVDLTLDHVEVYNKRSKRVNPLKAGAKLLKLDTIRLRPKYQDLWLDKHSFQRLKEKYNITHR